MNQEQLATLVEFLNNGPVTNEELMDQDQELSLSNNVVTIEEHRRNHLIALIQNFPNEEVLAATHLLTTMRYTKGPDKGKLLSSYLQKKAHKYISDNLYKTQSTNDKLVRENKRLHRQTDKLIKKTQSLGARSRILYNQKSHHIMEIRSLVRNSQTISDIASKNKVKSLFKINKREYSSKTIWLASNVSELYVTTQISQIAQALAFVIMVDESTHGEIKNLAICYQAWNKQKQTPTVTMVHLKNIFKCNSETISNSVIESIQKEGLDVTKCILWTTDNTAYMSSNKNGAIALFNRKTDGKLIQLPHGRRAHELPDKVYEWKEYLKNIRDNFEMFFLMKIKYANELKNDIDNGNTNYFSLYTLLLQDNECYEEFENFSNMSLSLKESKLRLASDKIEYEDLKSGLKKVRTQRKNNQIPHCKKFSLYNSEKKLRQTSLIIY
ncbi:28727_t:CDS:2 [Gigaspora margarita]|uniref:28727_t:CDS:1 n=1 Tax=Gigaspora margarita TaxID=4874 RepID=A0ABN7UEL2_GIGMA|nr:28727_t:CDS:2 [Gigaspora margarita]